MAYKHREFARRHPQTRLLAEIVVLIAQLKKIWERIESDEHASGIEF